MNENNSGKTIAIIFIIFAILINFIEEFSYYYEEGDISTPFDYARITDVEYKAILVDEPNSNAKVIVTERLTFDIHAASKNNLFWELWRDLPEEYIDGLKVEYKVNSVKQINEDKSEVIYNESPKLYWNDSDYTNTSGRYGPGKWYHSKGPYNENTGQYECVFFYVNGLYREEVTFEIEYEMTNAAFKYKDVSELYLTFYSEDTINYLESFKGEILIPLKDMPRNGNYEAHTYGTTLETFPFTESKTKNPGYYTFSIDLDEDDLKFKPYNEYIEFSLLAYGEDKHIFTEYAPNNMYSYDYVLQELRDENEYYESLRENSKKRKIITLVIFLIITTITIVNTLKKDKNIRKKYLLYKPTQEIEYFRDIPSDLDPHFAAALVFIKDKQPKDETNGYAAIMLSLIRKEYIELNRIDNSKDWTSDNIKIIVKYKPNNTPIRLSEAIQNTYTAEFPKIEQPIQSILPTQNTNQHLQNIQPTIIPQSINTVMQPQVNIPQPNLPNLEALTPTEEKYFNLIVRHSLENEITMNNFQSKVSMDYDNTNTFVKNIENSTVNIGISQGYFQKANYKEPKEKINNLSKKYITIGILLITLVNIISYNTRLDLAFGSFTILGITLIISAIYLKKISKNYILLTQYGEDEYAKWKGLYNFLNSNTLMNERTVIELPLWEKYLVYATAFGISEKVIKALEIRCPEVDMSPMLKNPYYRSTNFHTSNRSFHYATRRASTMSRSSSYSGGGYYGGGGRGGGGGGGGH